MDDAVATQDTVTPLISQIRRVGQEVPGAAVRIAAECVSGTGLVIATELANAFGEDDTDAAWMLTAEPGPVEGYGDCAYGTGCRRTDQDAELGTAERK